MGKSVVLHLFERPELRMHYREEKKSPAPGGIQTHDLSVMRQTLYLCATTAAVRINEVSFALAYNALVF